MVCWFVASENVQKKLSISKVAYLARYWMLKITMRNVTMHACCCRFPMLSHFFIIMRLVLPYKHDNSSLAWLSALIAPPSQCMSSGFLIDVTHVITGIRLEATGRRTRLGCRVHIVTNEPAFAFRHMAISDLISRTTEVLFHISLTCGLRSRIRVAKTATLYPVKRPILLNILLSFSFSLAEISTGFLCFPISWTSISQPVHNPVLV